MNSFNLPKNPTLVEVDVGMTLREYFAALAMQGILSNSDVGSTILTPAQCAETALEYTDALIAALNKGEDD